MDTPQGTFYRVYFDIYLTLDGSEFSAELVCQGEVMGRYVTPEHSMHPYKTGLQLTSILGVRRNLDKSIGGSLALPIPHFSSSFFLSFHFTFF